MKLNDLSGVVGISSIAIAAIVIILAIFHFIPSNTPIENMAEQIIESQTGIVIDLPSTEEIK